MLSLIHYSISSINNDLRAAAELAAKFSSHCSEVQTSANKVLVESTNGEAPSCSIDDTRQLAKPKSKRLLNFAFCIPAAAAYVDRIYQLSAPAWIESDYYTLPALPLLAATVVVVGLGIIIIITRLD